MELTTAIGIIIGVSICYFFIRKQRNIFLETNFKMDLYTLRDKLRGDAINEDINHKSWAFEYFDLTISKLIQESYFVSLPFIVLADRQHSDDEKEVKRFLGKLDYECKKNKNLADIRKQVSFLVFKYISEQHKYSFTHILFVCARFVGKMKLGIAKRFTIKYDYKRLSNEIFTLPETSAAYC